MEKRNSCRAIIFKDGKLVVMYRKKEEKEYYTLPGGGMEPGETELECVVRECVEEFGIDVEPLKKVYILEDAKTIQNYYVCKWVSGELGTGVGEEFQADRNRGVYLPTMVEFEKMESLPIVPGEIKERILKDCNFDAEDNFESVKEIIKIESNFGA